MSFLAFLFYTPSTLLAYVEPSLVAGVVEPAVVVFERDTTGAISSDGQTVPVAPVVRLFWQPIKVLHILV